MQWIDATAKEWRNQCVQSAQAGEDFQVADYAESDRQFLRNLGYFYRYAMAETPSSFHFRLIHED